MSIMLLATLASGKALFETESRSNGERASEPDATRHARSGGGSYASQSPHMGPDGFPFAL
jgi:hypothetical protein